MVNIATRVPRPNGFRAIPCARTRSFRRFFNSPEAGGARLRQFQSAGSGVIIDAKNGYIVTNHHVIENASEITVTLLDNRTFSGQSDRQR